MGILLYKTQMDHSPDFPPHFLSSVDTTPLIEEIASVRDNGEYLPPPPAPTPVQAAIGSLQDLVDLSSMAKDHTTAEAANALLKILAELE